MLKRLCTSRFLNYFFSFVLLVTSTLNFTSFIPTQTVSAYSDVSNMTDADFFGVWNGSSWTTEGKINYSYSNGLAQVESCAKAGDYTGAKAALLSYYRSRTSRSIVPLDGSVRNTNLANLVKDDIFPVSATESYIGSVTVGNAYQTVSLDTSGDVQSVMENGGIITFLLMARTKSNSDSCFYSREQGTNQPTLTVTVNGTAQDITPIKDTYIQAGTNGNVNYGASNLLQVKESGYPYDDFEKRAYITFDLSVISASPSSAVLKLYGENVAGTGNQEVMVFKAADSTYIESGTSGLTWNTTASRVFSWQGSNSSTDWNEPASGAYSQFVNNLCISAFLQQLSYEYYVTADTSYSDKIVSLMLDFINDKGNSNPAYDNSIDSARRAENWLTAYDYVLDSPSMDANANIAVIKQLWQLGNWLADTNYEYPQDTTVWNDAHYHSTNNWGVMETKGLYKIAVYFPELTLSPTWKSLADDRSTALINALNYSDGAYSEATTSYELGVLNDFYTIKQFGSINGQTFSATFDDKLKQMSWYAVDRSSPTGFDILYGDSGYNDRKPTLLSLGNTLNDEGLKYFGSGGVTGIVPQYTSVIYPVDKTATMKSGWDSDALTMHISTQTFNLSGTGARSHRHKDMLSTIMNAYGATLIPDNGSKGYDSDAVTLWLRTNQAHNTIMINNTDQNDSGTSGIPEWHSNGSFDFYEGYTTAASTTSGFKSSRDVLFIKPGYWVVSDYITAPSGTNTYEQNWHMMPNANAALDGTTKKTQSHFNGAPNIQVVPADPSTLGASLQDSYNVGIAGAVNNTKRAAYTKTVAGDVTFDTVLYPTAAADMARNVAVTRLATIPEVATTIATALKIDLDAGNGGNTGYYYLSHEAQLSGSLRGFGSYACDGKVAYVETDSSGQKKSVLLSNGKKFQENGANVVDSPYQIKDIGVSWSGTTVNINGTGLKTDTNSATAIAIYAPNATGATFNGNEVSFTKVGNYIYAVGVVVKDWEFNSDGNLEGWTLSSGMTGSVAGGKLNLTCAAVNQSLQSANNLSIDTSKAENKSILISMKNNTASDIGKVYWITDSDQTWDERKKANFVLVPNDTGYREYQIDMTNNALWSGNLRQIKIIPGENVSGGTASIDYIQVAAAKMTSGTINPVADTYIQDGASADTNFGTASRFYTRNLSTQNKKGLLKFDLSSFGTVYPTSAKLRLYLYDCSVQDPKTMTLYGNNNTDWTETGVTWNTAPTPDTSIASVDVGAKGSWYEWDVSSYVYSHWMDKVVSFELVKTGGPDSNNIFYSKENTSNRPELVIQGGPTVYMPTADTYVDSVNPTKNYGTGTTFLVRSTTNNEKRGLLKFDFSSITGTAAISAKLRVYLYDTSVPGSKTYTVYGNNNETWSETGVTYNATPTPDTSISSTTIGAKGSWYEFDVTSYINSHWTDKAVSLEILKTGGEESNSIFFSKENSTFKPQLVITAN